MLLLCLTRTQLTQPFLFLSQPVWAQLIVSARMHLYPARPAVRLQQQVAEPLRSTAPKCGWGWVQGGVGRCTCWIRIVRCNAIMSVMLGRGTCHQPH